MDLQLIELNAVLYNGSESYIAKQAAEYDTPGLLDHPMFLLLGHSLTVMCAGCVVSAVRSMCGGRTRLRLQARRWVRPASLPPQSTASGRATSPASESSPA
jgi:hypothetical protein